MTEKRFTNNDNNDFNDSLIDRSFTDNLTKKIYHIDELKEEFKERFGRDFE